jgi:hypothetical protein
MTKIRKDFSGVAGEYLVAAELSKRGFKLSLYTKIMLLS